MNYSPFILAIGLLFPSLVVALDVVPYTITDGRRIDASLTGQIGDWQLGRRLYFDRELTGCSTCHGSPAGPGAETRQDVQAPNLEGIASRLSNGEIRLWIAAPIAINPDTEMPAYYLPGQRTNPDAPIINGPRLTAPQIEDLVAYLSRQKSAE
ncbi:MAG: c-type cytochrome [Pseudomonadota bacterium]